MNLSATYYFCARPQALVTHQCEERPDDKTPGCWRFLSAVSIWPDLSASPYCTAIQIKRRRNT